MLYRRRYMNAAPTEGKGSMDTDTRKALREVAAGEVEQFSITDLEGLGLMDLESLAGRLDDDAIMQQAERLLEEDPEPWSMQDADPVANPDRLPYEVRDYAGERRADFWIRGDAERYVREENRKRERGFVLSIGLGNAAMSEAEHVGQALEELAQTIADGERDGNVFDENGNGVGHWSLTEPAPETITVKAANLKAGQRVKIGDDFETVEQDAAPMPGHRVEVITEPYSEGVLWPAVRPCEVLLNEEAV
jgi:hypothetical protein